MNDADRELVSAARPLVTNMILSEDDRSAATVASAIRSSSGGIYTGVCVHLSCGIGFCAEHAAVAEMIKHGETQVDTIVAVTDEDIYEPCGRCRELLAQIDSRNKSARVILKEDLVVTLAELLPHHYLTQ